MQTLQERTQLKQLMRLYFTTTGRLLFWQEDADLNQIRQQILSLLLSILGKEEYREDCAHILECTAPLQTLEDCAMLKLSDTVIPRQQLSYYDMKADSLRLYQVRQTQSFDMDVLLMDNRQAVIDGDPGALRLGACLSWLGLDSRSSAEAALRYWTVLAYTGDYFAMQALEYAAVQRGAHADASLWRTVREIFEESDRQFTITVPERFLTEADPAAVNTAQVILAVRRRCADDGQELLPIPLLQYAIDSKEDVATKLQNLYAPPETYHTMLAKQSRRPAAPLGFV